jgi:hypothetical protein
MRHFVVEALRDTFLYGSDVAIYTGGGLDSVLASADQLSLMAVVDEVTGSGSLSATLQHGPDQRSWVDVTGGPHLSGAIAPSAVTTLAGSFLASSVALGPFVRVKLSLTTSTRARVRLVVTGRGA